MTRELIEGVSLDTPAPGARAEGACWVGIRPFRRGIAQLILSRLGQISGELLEYRGAEFPADLLAGLILPRDLVSDGGVRRPGR